MVFGLNCLRGHSKGTSLRKRGLRVHQKRDKKWQRGKEVQPKNWCHSLKVFMCPFLLSIDFAPLYLMTFCYYSERQRKHIQDAIWASGIPLLADARHFDFTTLSTWLVNTCVTICDSACAHRLELQFLTFYHPSI